MNALIHTEQVMEQREENILISRIKQKIKVWQKTYRFNLFKSDTEYRCYQLIDELYDLMGRTPYYKCGRIFNSIENIYDIIDRVKKSDSIEEIETLYLTAEKLTAL